MLLKICISCASEGIIPSFPIESLWMDASLAVCYRCTQIEVLQGQTIYYAAEITTELWLTEVNRRLSQISEKGMWLAALCSLSRKEVIFMGYSILNKKFCAHILRYFR